MTAFSTFYDSIRALLDDTDPDVQLYENSQLDKAIAASLNLTKVSTDVATYRASGTNVTPDLTIESDARGWAQLVYHTAKTFCSGKRALSWRTRAFAETVGQNREMMDAILSGIHDLDGSSIGTDEL